MSAATRRRRASTLAWRGGCSLFTGAAIDGTASPASLDAAGAGSEHRKAPMSVKSTSGHQSKKAGRRMRELLRTNNLVRLSYLQALLRAEAIEAQVLDGHMRRSEEHTSELQSLMRISY